MYYWRISKYDPAFRSESGGYYLEDWTSASDIDNIFGGSKLTYERYIQIENVYIQSIYSFLHDVKISSLIMINLEKKMSLNEKSVLNRYRLNWLLNSHKIYDGKTIDISDIGDICRLNLRELIWCKLELQNKFYIHFGYDYYVYVGSCFNCENAIRTTQEVGLYVEFKKSPYLEW